MSEIVETIPESLDSAVSAAMAWLAERDGRTWSVTAIVDPEATLTQRAAGEASLDLRLVVCSGELCQREDLKLRPAASGFEICGADAREDPPAELDPTPGARKGWLDEKLAAHPFVLLLFYRGFW